MASHRARVVKSFLVGVIWLLLRGPEDVVLIQCNQSRLIPYVMAVAVLDFVVVTYLVYQYLHYRLKRPWKCPVCDGWGRRAFMPGMTSDAKAQLTACMACEGKGYVWEVTKEAEG